MFERERPQRGKVAPLRGERALLHPLWLTALVFLALNDHLLKSLGGFALLTGKLSDFAGLIVAPVLLITVLRVSSRRVAILCFVAVGAVFTTIQLSSSAALAWDGVMSAVALPWQTWSDPSDLIALPALLVAWFVFVPRMQAQPLKKSWTRAAQVVAAGTGLLCCVATSPPERRVVDPGPQQCQDDWGNIGPCDVELCWHSSGAAVYCQFADCGSSSGSCASDNEWDCQDAGGEWINGTCLGYCEGIRNSAGECVFEHTDLSLYLYNNTQHPALMRVMRLRDDVQLDCAAIEAMPERLLKRQLFEAAGSWTIGPREVRPLAESAWGDEFCSAIILTDDIMPAQLITFDPTLTIWSVWDEPTLTNLDSPGIVLIEGPDGPFIEAYGDGPQITRLTSTPRPEEFGEACQPVEDGARLEWSPTTVVEHQTTLQSIESGADGCLALDFSVGGDSNDRWYVCMPDDGFPFSPGDTLQISSELESEGQSLRFRRMASASDDEEYDPTRETELFILREYSQTVTALSGVQLSVNALETCAAVPDMDCGTVHQAATASLIIRTAEGTTEVEAGSMEPGEWLETVGHDGRGLSIHMARVALRPVVATDCSSGPNRAGEDVEMVIVRRPLEGQNDGGQDDEE